MQNPIEMSLNIIQTISKQAIIEMVRALFFLQDNPENACDTIYDLQRPGAKDSQSSTHKMINLPATTTSWQNRSTQEFHQNNSDRISIHKFHRGESDNPANFYVF